MQGGLCRHPPVYISFPVARQDRGWGGTRAAGRGGYCAGGSDRLLQILCHDAWVEMSHTQMWASSCLRVVLTNGLRVSGDPQIHRDERRSASGWCPKVLDGAGGLVGVRHDKHFVHSYTSLFLYQHRAGARIQTRHRLQRARSHSQPKDPARWEHHSVISGLGRHLLVFDTSSLHQQGAHELTRIMPSGRLHHTYSNTTHGLGHAHTHG